MRSNRSINSNSSRQNIRNTRAKADRRKKENAKTGLDSLAKENENLMGSMHDMIEEDKKRRATYEENSRLEPGKDKDHSRSYNRRKRQDDSYIEKSYDAYRPSERKRSTGAKQKPDFGGSRIERRGNSFVRDSRVNRSRLDRSYSRSKSKSRQGLGKSNRSLIKKTKKKDSYKDDSYYANDQKKDYGDDSYYDNKKKDYGDDSYYDNKKKDFKDDSFYDNKKKDYGDDSYYDKKKKDDSFYDNKKKDDSFYDNKKKKYADDSFYDRKKKDFKDDSYLDKSRNKYPDDSYLKDKKDDSYLKDKKDDSYLNAKNYSPPSEKRKESFRERKESSPKSKRSFKEESPKKQTKTNEVFRNASPKDEKSGYSRPSFEPANRSKHESRIKSSIRSRITRGGSRSNLKKPSKAKRLPAWNSKNAMMIPSSKPKLMMREKDMEVQLVMVTMKKIISQLKAQNKGLKEKKEQLVKENEMKEKKIKDLATKLEDYEMMEKMDQDRPSKKVKIDIEELDGRMKNIDDFLNNLKYNPSTNQLIDDITKKNQDYNALTKENGDVHQALKKNIQGIKRTLNDINENA